MSAPATPTAPHTSVHRWPWRTEEFVSMALSFTGILALGYWILTANRESIPGSAALALIAATVLAAPASVYYLYRVKKKRTDTSQVTITIMGTVVRSESNGPLGKSQADLAKADTISYRRYNSDETFMISDGDNSVRIPLRAANDPEVARLLGVAFDTAAATATEAQALRDKIPTA